MPAPSAGMTVNRYLELELLRLEILIGEGRGVRCLNDDERVIRGRVAGVARLRELAVGLVELAAEAQLDRNVEQGEGRANRRIEKLRYRETLEARHRARDDHETLLELLERVARERPIVRLAGEAELGVARLDQHAHERRHLRIERGGLRVGIAERTLRDGAMRPSGEGERDKHG